MGLIWRRSTKYLLLFAVCFLAANSSAQVAVETELKDPEPVIAAEAAISDSDMQSRIERIYSEIDTLEKVVVEVNEGVVSLTGSVSNEKQASMAKNLAIRIEGVVTVKDQLERSLDIDGNVAPLLESGQQKLRLLVRGIPLLLLALTVFLFIAACGHYLAKWTSLWRRIAPNVFLAELMSQAIRIGFVIVALVVSLSIVGASALLGTILGGAGVLGLAIGFAVRDSLENYISSIMLSLRQPFRPKDHVVINEHEGIVVRLTSRATVLMTLNGNHLRIPNSTVFKAVIENYTTNPERRFDFTLGVDAADDPVAAIQVGRDAIGALEFVLQEPKPGAVIVEVGDSSILIKFMGWINQTETNFGSARSLTIRAVTSVLEERGFTLPEPIYRLRFDGQVPPSIKPVGQSNSSVNQSTDKSPKQAVGLTEDEILDIRPDQHLTDKINDERRETQSTDLLDDSQPIE